MNTKTGPPFSAIIHAPYKDYFTDIMKASLWSIGLEILKIITPKPEQAMDALHRFYNVMNDNSVILQNKFRQNNISGGKHIYKHKSRNSGHTGDKKSKELGFKNENYKKTKKNEKNERVEKGIQNNHKLNNSIKKEYSEINNKYEEKQKNNNKFNHPKIDNNHKFQAH